MNVAMIVTVLRKRSESNAEPKSIQDKGNEQDRWTTTVDDDRGIRHSLSSRSSRHSRVPGRRSQSRPTHSADEPMTCRLNVLPASALRDASGEVFLVQWNILGPAICPPQCMTMATRNYSRIWKA